MIATIFVKDFSGSKCIHKEDADALRLDILKNLNNGGQVVLDFSGTKQWSYDFIYRAIGMLLMSTTTYCLNNSFLVKNARRNTRDLINLALTDYQIADKRKVTIA